MQMMTLQSCCITLIPNHHHRCLASVRSSLRDKMGIAFLISKASSKGRLKGSTYMYFTLHLSKRTQNALTLPIYNFIYDFKILKSP
jgi:hypothetical protein